MVYTHGLIDTVILFLSFRHVEVPGYGLYPWWFIRHGYPVSVL
jgi:hypothetical protein